MYPTSTRHLLQYLTTFNYLPSRVLQTPQNGYHSSTLRQLSLFHIKFTPPIYIVFGRSSYPTVFQPHPILALSWTVFSRIPITTPRHRVMTSKNSIPQIIHPCYFQYFSYPTNYSGNIEHYISTASLSTPNIESRPLIEFTSQNTRAYHHRYILQSNTIPYRYCVIQDVHWGPSTSSSHQ